MHFTWGLNYRLFLELDGLTTAFCETYEPTKGFAKRTGAEMINAVKSIYPKPRKAVLHVQKWSAHTGTWQDWYVKRVKP